MIKFVTILKYRVLYILYLNIIVIFSGCTLSQTSGLDCNPIKPNYIYSKIQGYFNIYRATHLLKLNENNFLVAGYNQQSQDSSWIDIIDRVGKNKYLKPVQLPIIGNITEIANVSDTSFLAIIGHKIVHFNILGKIIDSSKLSQINSSINPVTLIKIEPNRYLGIYNNRNDKTYFQYFNNKCIPIGSSFEYPFYIQGNGVNKFMNVNKDEIVIQGNVNILINLNNRTVKPLNLYNNEINHYCTLPNGNFVLAGSKHVDGLSLEYHLKAFNPTLSIIKDSTYRIGGHGDDIIDYIIYSTKDDKIKAFCRKVDGLGKIVNSFLNIDPVNFAVTESNIISQIDVFSVKNVLELDDGCLLGIGLNSELFKCSPHGHF